MTTPLRQVRSPLQRDVEDVLATCAEFDPDEVLIVCIKSGEAQVFSTGTFSTMRTLGALELMKQRVLYG